jgi:hypothetical protein
MSTQPEYRVFYASATRSGRRQPRHIGEAEMGKRGMQTKFGTAGCGVHIQWFPESGEQGKIENATCPRCRRLHGLPPLRERMSRKRQGNG